MKWLADGAYCKQTADFVGYSHDTYTYVYLCACTMFGRLRDPV